MRDAIFDIAIFDDLSRANPDDTNCLKIALVHTYASGISVFQVLLYRRLISNRFNREFLEEI